MVEIFNTCPIRKRALLMGIDPQCIVKDTGTSDDGREQCKTSERRQTCAVVFDHRVFASKDTSFVSASTFARRNLGDGTAVIVLPEGRKKEAHEIEIPAGVEVFV